MLEEILEFNYCKPTPKLKAVLPRVRVLSRVQVVFEEIEGELEQNTVNRTIAQVPLYTPLEWELMRMNMMRNEYDYD